MTERFCGIDYGTKMSGNTAMAFLDGTAIQVLQCPQNKDADQWILSQVAIFKIEKIYLDAPLTLPGGFMGYNDQFHYRACDLELGAMSPMFLGGLTARAISLSKILEKLKVLSIEVYPGGFIRNQEVLKEKYQKKNLSTVADMADNLQKILPNNVQTTIQNYHQIDALICWWIGHRHIHGLAKAYGNTQEGQIWI